MRVFYITDAEARTFPKARPAAIPDERLNTRAVAPDADERKRLRELAIDLEMVHGQHAGDNATLADAVTALREVAGDD